MSRIHQISNVVSTPWRYGQRKVGVECGSQKIMNFVSQLVSSSSPLKSTSIHTLDATPSHEGNNEDYHHELFKLRSQFHSNTLVVGGDHSVAIGSVMGSLHAVNQLTANQQTQLHNAGHQTPLNQVGRRAFSSESAVAGKQKKLGVIWIDAHADINTLASSASGNVHGMPLAFCTGIDTSWQWVNEANLKLDFQDLYYWGIRDLDNFEIDVIDRYGIKVLQDKEECMQIVDEYEHIHTSLDIDGIDPQYAPSTGTRAEHGLELKDVLDYLYYLKFARKSIGFDLVEYNPDIGTEEEKRTTEQTVKSLLHAIV